MMFEDEVKGRRILRGTIAINIICLLVLVFYIFHEISLELLDDQNPLSFHPWWSLLWMTVFVISITLITVQLTLDVDMMLFRRSLELEENGGRERRRVELWTKMSSGFLVICTLCFSLSILVSGRAQDNPGVIFILGFGGLTLRLILLYMAYQYLAHLNYNPLGQPSHPLIPFFV